MPGSSPVLVARRSLSVLISVDLPTLGMPQISTRKGLTMPPRSGASARQAATSTLAGPGTLASRPSARVSGSALKCASQAAVRSASARSCLFSTFNAGLPCVRLASKGLRLEPGRRASSSSITTSMSGSRLAMAFWVECM